MTEERLKEIEQYMEHSFVDDESGAPVIKELIAKVRRLQESHDQIAVARKKDIAKMNEMGADYIRLSGENDKHRFENQSLRKILERTRIVLRKADRAFTNNECFNWGSLESEAGLIDAALGEGK